MDIFKLIFEHDLLLEELSVSGDSRNKAKPELSLDDFMKPIPSYCRYYFSGTRLKENEYGLTTLRKKAKVYEGIQNALGETRLWARNGRNYGSIAEAMKTGGLSVVVASGTRPEADLQTLEINDNSGVRDRIPLLKALLDEGKKVIFFEKAKNGTDLHLFSRENMYEALFHSIQPLVAPDFRYFSINGRRLSGERMFYFETWTLDRPPHGFEEVSPDSVL
ncbi:MAG: hypothetical protein WD266_11625 [Balneolales bacterium]